MLTYLINVTNDLLACAVVIGVCFAFTDRFTKSAGRIALRCGIALGIIAAAVRTYITNTRRLTGGWKVGAYGYAAALALFIITAAVLIVMTKGFYRRDAESLPDPKMAAECSVSVSCGLLCAAYLYCAAPNVMIYPFKFDTGGNGVLSTDYLFRLGGYLLGLIVCALSAVSAYRLLTVAFQKGFRRLAAGSFWFSNVLYAVYGFAKLMLVLTPRKIVDSRVLFSFSAASNNHSQYYTYALFLLMLGIAVFLAVKSRTMNEPYSNKAQRRKQRAVWRSGRRSGYVLAVCFIMSILCATLFVKLNTVEIREAPVEEPNMIDGGKTMFVPLEMVEDGHLHRFGYTTPDGNPTRWIVVLKQENTTNYGVGLDACEICGEAGYYENQDGQIVCKKCNVVMNKTTIGMKGGCNPIIIDYDIDENGITVPVDEMIKNQDRFKK